MVLFRTRGEGRGLTNPILWSQFGVLFPVAAVTVQGYVSSSSIHFPHWLYISLCIPAFVLFCFFREGAGVVLELLKVKYSSLLCYSDSEFSCLPEIPLASITKLPHEQTPRILRFSKPLRIFGSALFSYFPTIYQEAKSPKVGSHLTDKLLKTVYIINLMKVWRKSVFLV